MSTVRYKILFVCHGNICRSPMAEFIMKDMVSKRGVGYCFPQIDSAAVSNEEEGCGVYPRAASKLRSHGIICTGKVARQITADDYDCYDMIIAMDRQNISFIRHIIGEERMDKVRLLLGRDVADPWYTGDFDKAYDDIVEGCTKLIDELSPHTETAIFAGGCFWGVEYWMRRLDGVLNVTAGYIGGFKENPTYKEVKSQSTGHYEAVSVLYDTACVGFTEVAKRFFEIHDPTQKDGQGIDIGSQYKSAIFYLNPEQKRISEKLVEFLKSQGLDVATSILQATTFYPAENYHQNYCDVIGIQPECHVYTPREW